MQGVSGAISWSKSPEKDIFDVFILMTDSDYSQEVNKMNEHDIANDHSFTTGHLLWVICGFERL